LDEWWRFLHATVQYRQCDCFGVNVALHAA
jgi:hypothetical protein